ncbi:MAG: hypothetical protein AB8B92_01210 [Gammaproteobacteria bacterium]
MTPHNPIKFFAMIWALAIIIALIGFNFKWGHLPKLIDSFMSVTLLAPFALPKSFTDTIGITRLNSARGVVPAAAIYWPIVIALHWLAYKSKSIMVFIMLGAIVLLSSYTWFVVGTGMMGI